MDFPEFWKIIEQRMNYAPPDILNVKQILTICGFTTLQNISVLSQKKKIEELELEFRKMKEGGQFSTEKNLLNEKFALGTKSIINSIANLAKKGFFSENEVDAKATLQRVYDNCKQVRPIHFYSVTILDSQFFCV